jgi:FSR family fosmidomycin resistance protein-like MFS transporter
MDTSNGLQRTRLALVTWGHFVNDCYMGFFTPVLPLLIEKLALSLTAASGLAAIPSIASSVFQPLYGMASDRIRGRFFILLGPLLSMLGMGLIGAAPNAACLGFLLLLAGVGAAAFHPQAVAAAGTVSGHRKGLGISVFIFGGSLGFALGPLVIIGMIQLVGLERSWYIILPGLLSVGLLALALRIPTEVTDRKQMPSLLTAFQGVHTSMALLFTITVIREFTRLAVVTFLPIFLSRQGHSLMAGGVTLALFSLAGALGGMVGGSLSDTWGRKAVIIVSGIACVPLLYGMLHTDGLLALTLLSLAAAMLSGANATVIAFAQELVPSRAGTASSLVMGLGWGLAGLLLIGFGSLADGLGVARALDLVVLLPLLTIACAMALPQEASGQAAQIQPGRVVTAPRS